MDDKDKMKFGDQNGSMNLNSDPNSDDIEEQIAKSIEKLVEEETNVARAFVSGDESDYMNLYGKHVPEQGTQQSADLVNGATQVIPSIHQNEMDQLDGGATRVIPQVTPDMYQQNTTSGDLQNTTTMDPLQDDLMSSYTETGSTQKEDNGYRSQNRRASDSGRNSNQSNHSGMMNRASNKDQSGRSDEPQQVEQQPKYNDSLTGKQSGKDAGLTDNKQSDKHLDKHADKKPMTKKKKLILVGSIIAAILLIIGIVAAVIMINNNHKSYEYNYNQGMTRYEASNYSEALTYFEKAYETVEGKKSTDLMYAMYDCYMNENQKDKAKEMLQNLLSYDKNNEKALKALAQMYLDDDDGTSLTALITKYKGTKGEEYLKEFEISAPTASEDAGSYTKALEITLLADDDTTIYYTTDGKDPTQNSSVYTSAIKIEKGTTTLKAMAVNSIGLCSDISEYKYVVDYKKPDAPEINPASGTYESGQTFTIDNIADGATAYYTVDGTNPTTASTEYTGEVTIPEGNIVVCAIIVNEYDMESAVTRRNYNISITKTYSSTEAQTILKNKLISNSVLKSDGATSTAGNKVDIISQDNITVNSIEMYYFRVDENKNGSMVTQGYYGVGVKNGVCYKITASAGTYTAQEY